MVNRGIPDRLSAPAEQALDIGKVERHIGRAPVIALAAVRRRLHLAQQRIHLGRRKPPPGAHAGVAGERAAHRSRCAPSGPARRPIRRVRRRDRAPGPRHRRPAAAPGPRARRRLPARRVRAPGRTRRALQRAPQAVSRRLRRARRPRAAAVPGARPRARRAPPSSSRRRAAHARHAGRPARCRLRSRRGCRCRAAAPGRSPSGASRGSAPEQRRARVSVDRPQKALPVSASASDGAGGGNANCRRLAAEPPLCGRNSPGRNAASAAAATVVEARCPAAASAWRNAPTISPRTSAGVAKAHLGLGRMDVDVDLVGRPVEKQCDDRVAVARQHVLVGAAHRADQQFVAHRPAVDDEVLVARQSPVQGRQADEPAQPKPVALGVDLDRVLGEVAPEQCREPVRRAGRPRSAAAARRSSTRSSSPITVKAMPG